MAVEYDPLSPRWRDDPYPVYRELRDQAPVYWAEETGVYCISRFDDVHRVLTDADTFSSRAMFTMVMNGGRDDSPPLTWQTLKAMVRLTLANRSSPWAFARARNLIAADGNVHSVMRNTVNRGFTPRRVLALQPRIDEIADECIAKLGGSEPFDVVRDLAVPLPVTIIAEMLGIESERRADFKKWSDTIIHYNTGSGRADLFAPPLVSALVGLIRYMNKIAQDRRKNPREDLVSTLVANQAGDDGLNNMETSLFVNLLLVAGNETTTNLIGNAVHALLENPSELERVVADPALIPSLIEEAVRFDSPVQMVFRETTRETEISGTPLSAGSIVVALIGSGNHDERRFENPERFDVGRNAQGHLGFGFGKHFCLGAALARMEAGAALAKLVPRLQHYTRSSKDLRRIDSFLVRGPQELLLRPAA